MKYADKWNISIDDMEEVREKVEVEIDSELFYSIATYISLKVEYPEKISKQEISSFIEEVVTSYIDMHSHLHEES